MDKRSDAPSRTQTGAVDDTALLYRLGRGASVEEACLSGNLEAQGFQSWWQAQLARRLPQIEGVTHVPVRDAVEIHRDSNGVPHIFADHKEDLYFAYGYAMAQDRLWQLDYYRRQAQGRLAEILGADACPMATGGAIRALDRDIVARTIGFERIAQAKLAILDNEVGQYLSAFVAGINQLQTECRNNLPIEFALLDYSPEPWDPVDTLSIWTEFQYYLTVRLDVIVMPELARRELDNDGLFQAYLEGEVDAESILPLGMNSKTQAGRTGQAVGDPAEGIGSNNWAVAGKRTARGHTLLASDPHIAFNAVSCWYEAHLHGASGLNVAGAGYIGVPGILFGRNMDVAWGITNNICSQRDLYLEKTDPQHPGCFQSGKQWVPGKELVENIEVREQEPVELRVEFSSNGPIVNHLLHDSVRDFGPVSLKWMGAQNGPTELSEIGCMMQTNRAQNCQEFRVALKDWKVPTLSMVFADIHGHIGYQCAGHIPLRPTWNRGFRRGWDPNDAWQEVIPFEGLPAMSDPEEGWIRTANNRTAGNDFPYPLSGTWASGYRAQRIRQLLEEEVKVSTEDCMRWQMDTLSLRAGECLPVLQSLLADVSDWQIRAALDIWKDWNGRMEPDSIGSTLFETFFTLWQNAVAAERFSAQTASYLAGGIAGLAVLLLREDSTGWFEGDDRRRGLVIDTVLQAWHQLSSELGPDQAQWLWGRVHKIRLDHPLGYLPALGPLLDRGGQSVGGSGITVCNTGVDPNYMSAMGANYRIVAELDSQEPVLYAVDAAGQSGHAGSSNYCDQLPLWLNGQMKRLNLQPSKCKESAHNSLILQPNDREL